MKKKLRRELKKNIVKRLQKEAEELFKDCCKKRDKKCQLCGKSEFLQAHHIFSRKYKNIFLDVDNSVALCRECHTNVTFNDSAKETLRRKIDPAIYTRLYEQSLISGAFLDFKNISWLNCQKSILEEMIEKCSP